MIIILIKSGRLHALTHCTRSRCSHAQCLPFYPIPLFSIGLFTHLSCTGSCEARAGVSSLIYWYIFPIRLWMISLSPYACSLQYSARMTWRYHWYCVHCHYLSTSQSWPCLFHAFTAVLHFQHTHMNRRRDLPRAVSQLDPAALGPRGRSRSTSLIGPPGVKNQNYKIDT